MINEGEKSNLKKQNIIDYHIKRSNRNLLVTAITLAIIGILTTWLINNFIHNEIAFYVSMTATIILVLLFIFIYLVRISTPDKHSIINEISRYGAYQEIKKEIDKEIENDAIKFGDASFTQNWILYPKLYGLHITKRGELAWAYTKKTTHRINFQPYLIDYSVILHSVISDKKPGFVRKYSYEVKISDEKEAQKLLYFISQYTPWVMLGYSKKIEKMWIKEFPKTYSTITTKRMAYMLSANNYNAKIN